MAGTLYTIEEIDRYLQERGMSTDGDEATRRARAKSRRAREKPGFKRSKRKYLDSEKGKATQRAYAQTDVSKEAKRRYQKKNLSSYAARTAKYKAQKQAATSPLMTPAEDLAIKSVYKAAEGLSLPKKKWNVDHYVPLQASEKRGGKPIASGLHNLLNIRLMLEGANKGKQNLIPHTSLLQTETPTKNLFETLSRARGGFMPQRNEGTLPIAADDILNQSLLYFDPLLMKKRY
jgi:hypothetical protein